MKTFHCVSVFILLAVALSVLASARTATAQDSALFPLSGVRAIATGVSHLCTNHDGGMLCWGQNFTGQLGDGTRSSHSTPAYVTGLTSGIQAITAGGSHTCALTTDGGVMCWGQNLYGELGDNTVTDSAMPIRVKSLGSGARAISGGDGHNCALTAGGGAVCWGWNHFGQLGDGSKNDQSTPVDVVIATHGVFLPLIKQ